VFKQHQLVSALDRAATVTTTKYIVVNLLIGKAEQV